MTPNNRLKSGSATPKRRSLASEPLPIKRATDKGGRQLHRQRKKRHAGKRPVISVITVCFNGEAEIAGTIKSVFDQTYENIEYIVVDGGSTDGTLDIIRKYDDQIDLWISERDKGIFDAMNKGAALANGQWINFMNVGDSFYNKDVIADIFLKSGRNADFIYGDCKIVYNNGFSRTQKSRSIGLIWKGMRFSHQSLFCNREILKKNKFNIKRRFAADFELIYNCYMNKCTFQRLPFPFSTVAAEGQSDTQNINVILDWWSVVRKRSPSVRVDAHYIVLLMEIMGIVAIKKMFPRKVYNILLKRWWG